MTRTPAQESWDFESFPTHDAHTQDYWTKAGRMLHRLVRDVVQASGEKHGAGLAFDVGANPTQFSESLKDDGIKSFKDTWLPRVIVADRDDRILRFLCRLKRMEPRPLPVEKPEQKLARIVQRLESKGRIGRAVLDEEFGEDGAEELVNAVHGSTP